MEGGGMLGGRTQPDISVPNAPLGEPAVLTAPFKGVGLSHPPH